MCQSTIKRVTSRRLSGASRLLLQLSVPSLLGYLFKAYQIYASTRYRLPNHNSTPGPLLLLFHSQHVAHRTKAS